MSSRVYKRGKSPYWQVEWYDVSGQRHQRSSQCTDRAAALARLREWERSSADPARAASAEATLRDALDALIDLRAEEAKAGRKSHATVAFYVKKAGHPVRVFGADARMTDITAGAIDKYIARRRGEDASDSTIHKELVLLRSACALAARRGLWPHDVGRVFPRGFSPAYVPRTRWLTPDEVSALLPHLPIDRAAIVGWIVATGAEWSAVQGATAEDHDLAGGWVRVRGTKRLARDRVVPLAFAWQREMVEWSLEHARSQGPRLHRPWGNVRRDLHRACELAQIDPCSPHDLRRTFAHWLRSEGGSPSTVGAALGHRDGRMAERVYAKLGPEELRSAVSRECHNSVRDSMKPVAPLALPALRKRLERAGNAVPRDGVEPPTRGFSIPSSGIVVRLPASPFVKVAACDVTTVSGPRLRVAR